MDPAFALEIDEKLKDIRDKIRYDMICQYRTIFYVYTHEWLSIHRIQQLPLSSQLESSAPASARHDVRAIVFLQFLNEWMLRIQSVMIKLEKDNFLVLK